MATRNEDFNAFMDFTKQSLGLEDSVVERFALDVSRNFGGEYLYITNQVERMNRDKQIRSCYNGSNAEELALHYRLSKRQIFSIVHS